METREEDESRLLDLLVRATAGGKVAADVALPVVAKLLAAEVAEVPVDGSAAQLLDLLDGRGDLASAKLRDWLRAARMDEASRFQREAGMDAGSGGRFEFFLGDLPRRILPPWDLRRPVPPAVVVGVGAADALAELRQDGLDAEVPEFAVRLEQELRSASRSLRETGDEVDLVVPELLDRLPACSAGLRQRLRERIALLRQQQLERIDAALLVGELPSRVNERLLADVLMAKLAEPGLAPAVRRSILIAGCQWESPALGPLVRELAGGDRSLGELAEVLLRMRFGDEVAEAESASAWFEVQRLRYEERERGEVLPAAAVLRFWLAADLEVGAEDVAELERLVAEGSGTTRQDLVERFESRLSDGEWERLTGSPRDGARAVIPAKPARKLPALWAEHVQPFVVENWYMVAGIFMTIVGASLLAFYTWDRHWLIRYTLMPGMLALFTAGLARAGSWIAAKGDEFLGSASMLRGAALGLLPVNFMAVALLSADDEVSNKVLAVAVMGLIYVALAGWGLLRWCRAEHRTLGFPLGGTLLVLNALVALGPLAGALGGGRMYEVVVGLGFYVGFAFAAAAVIWFGVRCLDAAMLRERRVPWFFFVGLAGTFAQVFLWVHGHAGSWPQVHTYAPLLVLAGGLALFYDLRSAAVAGREAARGELGSVSSLGFGLVLLGVIMAMGDGPARVLALSLAGTLWICQGVWRERLAAAHFWVGLTMLSLAVAAVGLLDGFPRAWSPGLGVGLALACLGLMPLARSLRAELAEALRGMHFAVLVITAVVAVLAQWYLRTAPGVTALWLVGIAALCGAGAGREGAVRWVHVAMVVLAMAVPYLGFVDMRGHDWRGNTVVFGLAVLSVIWIGVSSSSGRFPTAARGRSTVLWFYGLLAVVAMVVRIFWEGARPAGLGGFAKLMDLGGPCLMAGALVCASYFSRSLVAGGMAAVIMVILFPELKATFDEVLPADLWGSGVGSSATALGLILLAFWMRGASFLRGLEPGDQFLDRYDFPLRRFDHTLATWPLIGSAGFLTGKIIGLNLLLYGEAVVRGAGIHWLSGLALVLCAACCLLLAVYFRWAWMGSRLLVQLGMAVHVAGVFALFGWVAPGLSWSWPTVVALLSMLTLHLLGRLGRRHFAWAGETLGRPAFDGLWFWSAVAAAVVINALAGGAEVSPMWILAVLLAGLLAWQELALRWLVQGGLLFLLLGSLVVAVRPGDGEALLWMMFGLLAIGSGLEFAGRLGDFLRPLARVEIWLATAVVVAWAAGDLTPGAGWLLGGSLLLAGRLHRSTPLVAMSLAVGYFWLARTWQPGWLTNSDLGALALLMALALPFGSVLLRRFPRLSRGSFPLSPFCCPDARVLVWAAAGCAIVSSLASEFATLAFSFGGMLHAARYPAEVPMFAALALVVAAWFQKHRVLGWLAVGASVQVNAHLVHEWFGEGLAAGGIGGWLVFALGLSLSTLVVLALRCLLRSERLREFLGSVCDVLASLILSAVVVNFFVSGALAGAGWRALVASAAMASVAALALRGSAPVLWPLYQAALGLAIWCTGFSIPVLRSPEFVLAGMVLPALYFWWRAERGGRVRGHHAGAALCFAGVPVLLWLAHDLTGALLFGSPMPARWFHLGAPAVLLMGVLMRRLEFAPGLPLMMVGSFFCATAIPGFGPSEHATRAAWVAVALGQVWIGMANYLPARLRAFFASAGAMEILIALLHLAVAAAFMAGGLWPGGALLLLGAGSVVLHVAFVCKRYWLHVIGVAELLAAPYLEAASGGVVGVDAVVWVLLGMWLVNLLCYDRAIRKIAPGGHNFFPFGIGVLVFCEVVFTNGAGSWVGLAAFALGGVLAAATRVSGAGQKGAVLLLGVPVWLCYFAVSNLVGEGSALPVLLALGVALVLASWARASSGRGDGHARGPRLGHRLRPELRQSGGLLGALVNCCALPVAGLVQFDQAVRGVGYGANELMALLAIYLGVAVSWARHGHYFPRFAASLVVQLCVYLMFQAVRMQLVLTTDAWQPAYDLWATVLASFALVGCRELGAMSERQSRAALALSLYAMPVVGLATVWANRLGTDAALLVVGVQSLVFAFLGRGQRESPYNAVAIFGFVGFVMMVFWTRLEFRVLHAYVVPAGVGTLALVQLFHRVIPPATRDGVRLFTLLSMIGSTGYAALLDERYPVVFHLTMLVLCLACMGLGGLLRVRLYLYIGFAGLLVNLGSVTYKVLGSMGRGPRMTAIGSLVLVGGIGVLAAAIYYKTHRRVMDLVIRRWRMRLAAWE